MSHFGCCRLCLGVACVPPEAVSTIEVVGQEIPCDAQKRLISRLCLLNAGRRKQCVYAKGKPNCCVLLTTTGTSTWAPPNWAKLQLMSRSILTVNEHHSSTVLSAPASCKSTKRNHNSTTYSSWLISAPWRAEKMLRIDVVWIPFVCNRMYGKSARTVAIVPHAKGVDMYYSCQSYFNHWARSFRSNPQMQAQEFAELHNLAYKKPQAMKQDRHD